MRSYFNLFLLTTSLEVPCANEHKVAAAIDLTDSALLPACQIKCGRIISIKHQENI